MNTNTLTHRFFRAAIQDVSEDERRHLVETIFSARSDLMGVRDAILQLEKARSLFVTEASDELKTIQRLAVFLQTAEGKRELPVPMVGMGKQAHPMYGEFKDYPFLACWSQPVPVRAEEKSIVGLQFLQLQLFLWCCSHPDQEEPALTALAVKTRRAIENCHANQRLFQNDNVTDPEWLEALADFVLADPDHPLHGTDAGLRKLANLRKRRRTRQAATAKPNINGTPIPPRY